MVMSAEALRSLWDQFAADRQSSARSALITYYLPYVSITVRRLLATTNPEEREDCESEVTLALIGAVDQFDPGRGVPFDRYLIRRLRGAVMDYRRRVDPLGRAARARVEAISTLKAAGESEETIMALLDIPREVYDAMASLGRASHLRPPSVSVADGEEVLDSGLEQAASDSPSVHEETLLRFRREIVGRALAQLTARDRLLIDRLGNRGLRALAREQGVPASRVRAQVHRAVERLKEHLEPHLYLWQEENMRYDIVPESWMPLPAAGKLSRVVAHWTSGTYKPNATDRIHYHYLIDGEGTMHRGDFSPPDNLNTADGTYAAHTYHANTGSIGIALAAMRGATQQPFSAGDYPITRTQWNHLILAVADLCRRYGILPTKQTVLTHCEVGAHLGIPQRGKWDIARLPFDRGGWSEQPVGDELRARVLRLLDSPRD